ncbi:MAG: hypothetical protein J6M24_04270 [Lachnospiraceae bacterium]|nr:hypothetical protein [Lachnospiraceae bacterium]
MNGLDLLIAIGNIDAEYIEKGKKESVKKDLSGIKKIVAVCSTAAVLSGLLLVIPGVIKNGKRLENNNPKIISIKSDQSIIDDTAEKIDAAYEIVYYKRTFVEAKVIGTEEFTELNIDGTAYKRYKYRCELDTIVSNPQEYSIPEEFVLCIGEMYMDRYPKIKEGDQLMVALTKGMSENGYEKDEFIWDLPNVVFRIENDKLKAVYEEDRQYENYTVSEFGNELLLTDKAVKKITEDMEDGKLEYDTEFGFTADEYRELLGKYKSRLED